MPTFNTAAMRFLLVFTLFMAHFALGAQSFDYFPDSVKAALAREPESAHDSIYNMIGEVYYAQFTDEGYGLALDCFNKALKLAEKYKHETFAVDMAYGIGTVYDALGDEPDKVLYYYKRTLDYWVNKGQQDHLHMAFLYSVAHAYNLVKDSTNSMACLHRLDKSKDYYKKSKPEIYKKYDLLIAYMTMRNNNIPDFLTRFDRVDKKFAFQNGRFPYGRFFAVCSWRYAFEKGDYPKAIDAMLFELKNSPTDSFILVPFLSKAYALSRNYEKAYEWEVLLNHLSYENLKISLRKDVTVKLLKTENEQKENEKRLKDKENRYLLAGLFLTLLLTGVAIYFWYANYKSKQELAKRHAEREVLITELSERNAEKTLLINEIHHRVKNNLQLMYGLATLQLPTIKEKNAKSLWQKHLSQIKAMSLVNEKLYNTEGVAAVGLERFMTEILTHFEHIYPSTSPIVVDNQIDSALEVSADFAVSFGLLFSELVSNAYKYAFLQVENPQLLLKMTENAGVLVFDYTDFGVMAAPSVFLSKNEGGAPLIQDLTRQLKGKVEIEQVPYLMYHFTFPRSLTK